MVLAGYWPLDEESGTTVKDYSGNNLDGTATSGHRDKPEMGVTGILDSTCFRFEPATDAGDYVSLPDENGQYPDKDISISAWVYSEKDRRETILDLNNAGSSNSSNDGGLVLRRNSDLTLQTYFHTTESTDIKVSGGSLSKNTWHHVILTRRKDTGLVNLYIDGERVASDSKPGGNIKYDYGSYDDDSVNIGRFIRSGASHDGWDGKIQHVRLYDHSLNQQEINYIYSVGKRGLHVSDKRSL